MLKRLPRLPRAHYAPVAFSRTARNYSDGIVPDSHRVPFSSVNGTYPHDNSSQNMGSFVKITSFSEFVHTFQSFTLFQFIIYSKKNYF